MTTSPLNILILDDESVLLDLLPMMLEPHQTTVCSNLNVACTHIASQSMVFDVLLCDLMMPDGGGLEFYAWLKGDYPTLSKRVIFVTGGIGNDLEKKVSETKQPVLYKPFSIAQLHSIIERVLLK